jgi:O-antigen/teichoic acid export membrane protein
MRELLGKIAYTGGAQGFSLAVATVVVLLTARWLGPGGRGTLAAVTTWVAVFSTVGCLSLGQVAIYRAASDKGRLWLAPTLGSLLFCAAAITLLGWIAVSVLFVIARNSVFRGISPLALVTGFSCLPLMIWEQYGSALLMAADRVAVYNRALVTGRIAYLLLVLVCWLLNLGILGVLAALFVSQAIVALTGIRWLFQASESPVRPDKKTIKELLSGGLKLHLNNICGGLMGPSSILITNGFLGSVETGHYQVANQLVSAFYLMPQAVSMATYGTIARLGPDAGWGMQRKLLAILGAILLLLGTVAAAVAPWGIPALLGARFAPAGAIFRILLLALPGSALSVALSPQWIGRGMFIQMSAITVFLALVNLGANFSLIPMWGIVGAAWATVLTYTLAAIIQIWMVTYCELRFRNRVVN